MQTASTSYANGCEMQRLDHMPSLDELAAGLRAAIATGQYAGPRVSASYAQTLVEKWRALRSAIRNWRAPVRSGRAGGLARRTALAQRHIWPRG